MSPNFNNNRFANIFTSLLSIKPLTLENFCDVLLEQLLTNTNSERGFIFSCLPDSNAAEIIAARDYQTKILQLAEHDLSRTLLREILQRKISLLIADASKDDRFANDISVRRLETKSVLAVPLLHEGRVLGALYLENNSMPYAFDEDDVLLLETVARFAVFFLHHARLLPVLFEREFIYPDKGQTPTEIVGRHPKMLAALDVVKRVADSSAIILIEGESGTGKELIARALHNQSKRAGNPFVAINCAAIPENLLESELFGYEKGAFTGATARHTGLIEQANGGTLFLDEISELAYPLQAKLLRFLQSNELQRVGGTSLKLDVRVVVATSKDLKSMVVANKFQDSLYFRLNVIPIQLPSLRERKSDIPLLIEYFRKKYAGVYNKNVIIDEEVCECLKEYEFGGNVRELENIIHRMVILSTDGCIRLGDLPAEFLSIQTQRLNLETDPLYKILATPLTDIEDLKRRRAEVHQLLNEQERELIKHTIENSNGNLTEAAHHLGLHRVTLHKLLKNHSDNKA